MEGRTLSPAERDAIGEYQEYQQRYFPKDEYKIIADFWAYNFNESEFYHPEVQTDNEARLNALNAYLKHMKEYTKRLTRAALLRNVHYEQFLELHQYEDSGHRNFRKAILAAAKDARDKLTFWQKQRDALLSDIFDQEAWNTQHSSPIESIARIRDVDTYDRVVVKNAKRFRRIQPSKAERARRKQQLERLQEQSDEDALSRVMAELKLEEKHHDDLLQHLEYRARFIVHVSLNDFLRQFNTRYFSSNQLVPYKQLFIEFKTENESNARIDVVLELFLNNLSRFWNKTHNITLVRKAVMRFGFDTVSLFNQNTIMPVIEYAQEVSKGDTLVLDNILGLIGFHFDSFKVYRDHVKYFFRDVYTPDELEMITTTWFEQRATALAHALRVYYNLLQKFEKQPEYEFLKLYIQKHPLFEGIFVDPLMTMGAKDRKLFYSTMQTGDIRRHMQHYHQWRQRLLKHFPLYQQIKTAVVPFCLHCLQDAALVDSEYRWTFCNTRCQEGFYDSLFVGNSMITADSLDEDIVLAAFGEERAQSVEQLRATLARELPRVDGLDERTLAAFTDPRIAGYHILSALRDRLLRLGWVREQGDGTFIITEEGTRNQYKL